MIELIIDYEDKVVFEIVLGNFNYDYAVVPEMEDAWIVWLKPEQVQELTDALKQPTLRMEVISSFNKDGSQYIWTEPQTIQWNHSINKYKNKLRPKKVWNEDTEEYDNVPYNETTALDKQVVRIFTKGGAPDRILIDA